MTNRKLIEDLGLDPKYTDWTIKQLLAHAVRSDSKKERASALSVVICGLERAGQITGFKEWLSEVYDEHINCEGEPDENK